MLKQQVKTFLDQVEVEHPQHYGGKDNPFEVIKIIDALNLNYYEGNILKYLLRYKNKNGVVDLKKAQFYLERFIKILEEKSEDEVEMIANYNDDMIVEDEREYLRI